jgi:hypothetical protein
MTDLPISKISESGGKITFGWEPPEDVGWYVFQDERGRVSNASPIYETGAREGELRDRVTFEAGHEPYHVIAYGLIAAGQYPAEQPPPPTTEPLWDGRASRLSSISGWKRLVCPVAGAGGSTPQLWEGYTFYDGDISIQSDPRFGKVFRVALNQDSRNPWWNCDGQPASKPSGELTKRRPIVPGQVDWYAMALKFPGPWRAGKWGLVAQLGYPTITSPPLGVAMANYYVSGAEPSLGIDRLAGTWTGDYAKMLQVHKPLIPLSQIQGKWVNVVVGVKWEIDHTGWVVFDAKIEGGLWKTYHEENDTPTYQVEPGKAWKNPMDKHGAYQDASGFPSTWENVHLSSGLMRFADEASAKAALA